MEDKKFQGTIGGEEYDLFKLVIPHHDEFQNNITSVIKTYADSYPSLEKIVVLDIGAGTGFTTKLALEADSRVCVTAVDNDERMIAILQNTFKNRVTTIQSDAIDFLSQQQNNSADIIVSGYCIHNMPPAWRNRLFFKSFRVLKSGGVIINADKIAVDDQTIHEQMLVRQLELFRKFKEIKREDLFAEWTEHYLEDEKIKFTETEQFEILKSAGFIDNKKIYRKEMEAVFVGTRP